MWTKLISHEAKREKKNPFRGSAAAAVLMRISNQMERRTILVEEALAGFLATTPRMESITPGNLERVDPLLKGNSRARLMTVVRRIRGFFRGAINVPLAASLQDATPRDVTRAQRAFYNLERIMDQALD
eukprot:sb/3475287/